MQGMLRAAIAALGSAIVISGPQQAAADDIFTWKPASAIPSGFYFGASIDALGGYRTNAQGAEVIPTTGPGTIIGADNLKYGNEGGYDIRARIGYAQWSIEGRYLGGFDWKSSVPNLGAVGNVRIGSFSNFGATALSADADGTFKSWEVNARWQVMPWLTPFIGIRQIEIGDQNTFNIAFPAFTAAYHFNTSQRANGVQAGIEARLVGPGTSWQPGPFYFDVDGRIGFYHLKNDTDFALLPSTGGSFTGGANGSKNNSPIVELGATVGYQITPFWDVHAGYRYISVRDAITASDYVVAATAQGTQGIVPDSRRLDLHMFTVGTKVLFQPPGTARVAPSHAAAIPPATVIPTGFHFGASIDGVYGDRKNAEGAAVVPTTGPGTIISADDLKYGSESGYDIRAYVGYARWSVEARYLGGLHWKSDVPDLGAVGNVRIGSFSNFGATALSADGASHFDSWEMNLRWQSLPWLTPFIGVRYIKIADDNSFNIAFPAFTAVYHFDTPQSATGVQIGADLRVFGLGTSWQPGPFYLDLDGRIGLFHYKADTDFSLLPSTGGSFTGGASSSKSNSPIVELGATLGYQITPNWDIHAGYRFISVRDAIMAGDYAVTATAQSSQNIVPDARGLSLHLVTIGTKVMFP
jgi:hypothetical protein